MRCTAILARGQFGWIDRSASLPALRIETAQGHSGDRDEVIRKVDAELDTYATGQTEITVAVDEGSGPVWGDDLIEGDEVLVDGAWREIEAFTLQKADQRWALVPQFGDVLDAPEDRIRRTLRGIGGLNGGTSRLARPVATIPPPNVRPG